MTLLQEFTLKVHTEPSHIDFLNRIFEAYDHLAVVTTIDNREGLLLIRGFGKVSVVRRILKGLPFKTELLEEEE